MKKRKRAIPFRIKAPADFHKIILQSATDLMIRTVNIDNPRKSNIRDLRKSMESTYELLAHTINMKSGRDFVFLRESMYGLSIHMHPTLGHYTIRVTGKVTDDPIEDQEFIIRVIPQDGHSTFTRTAHAYIVEAGQDKVQNAINEYRNL